MPDETVTSPKYIDRVAKLKQAVDNHSKNIQALNKELAKDKTLAVAPSDETEDQANVLLAKHKGLKSVFIWPKLQAIDESGSLSFKLSFTLFSYPDKAFKGSLAQSARLPGGSSSDPKALEELMNAAAPLIVGKFIANVGRLQ